MNKTLMFYQGEEPWPVGTILRVERLEVCTDLHWGPGICATLERVVFPSESVRRRMEIQLAPTYSEKQGYGDKTWDAEDT